MNLEELKALTAYEILETRDLSDISATGVLLRHRKSGAKVALVSNEDDNKVFSISFRTPPKDSTGVAHILEHSTLCGSRAFPVKDPFVELVKGSLNTFLNAITYPDKTVYPIASCNDKDFQNLMHVYLDAVFYPNVYRNESIFRQEGWHYEFDDEGNLQVNGVVYNEMKGALSAPDDILDREIMNSLYPDMCYGVESGGDPEVIPELTYEQFLEFHRTYYHPVNSYIYLYGDMDMAEKLRFMDEEYLSAFDRIEVDSEIPLQKPFTETARVHRDCPLGEGEDPEENTFLSVNFCLPAHQNKKFYLAMRVLDYALMSAPGAVLKRTLVESGIAKDVYSSYDRLLRQPAYSIVGKGTTLDREEEFLRLVRETLESAVEKGLDEEMLMAAINHFEFQYREADFGSTPRGLMYGLDLMVSWLYADEEAFALTQLGECFGELREDVKSGAFSRMIRELFLQNPHKSIVTVSPRAGVEEEREARYKERMKRIRESMSEAELVGIRKTLEDLRAFQETPDAKEDLEKLPQLLREDLKKEARPFYNEERSMGDTKVLFHELDTHGIGYLRLVFDLGRIPAKDLKYVGLLKLLLAMVDTDSHDYDHLNTALDLVTGGYTFGVSTYPVVAEAGAFKLTFEVRSKYLEGKLPEMMALTREILFTSHLEDAVRIREILEEEKSEMQATMFSAGHHVAMHRAYAALSQEARADEEVSGLEFYRFLSGLLSAYEERKEEMSTHLREVLHQIFRPENLMVDFIGSGKALEELLPEAQCLKDMLFTDATETGEPILPLLPKGEGLMNSGQVQFVCRAGSFRKRGLPYTGHLMALKNYLNYQYLWVNVRVVGGAYGCMSGFGRSGIGYLLSYRDPKLSETVKIYEEAPKALAEFDADERGMTQLIIGAVSDLDVPMNPASLGSRSFSAHMSGITYEETQKNRDELLSTQPEDMRGLAKYLEAILSDQCLAAVGNAAKLQSESALFERLENLM